MRHDPENRKKGAQRGKEREAGKLFYEDSQASLTVVMTDRRSPERFVDHFLARLGNSFVGTH